MLTRKPIILKCPVCGSSGFVDHMKTSDGIDFGWSVGCPRWSLNDKVHPNKQIRLAFHGFNSKQGAVDYWNKFVREFKEDGKAYNK